MTRMLPLLLLLLLLSFYSTAQLCPGGGTAFSTAVYFDPSTVAGCTSGTSCTGGTTFDNRAACEPTTAIDPCAPLPACAGAISTGSDLWFRFYATSTSVNINLIQSVSFIASIQAFSGGGTGCGSLTTIGCAVAGGPSSGINLPLSGLTVGSQYYFRVFGTANSAAQRTGTFCFCGTNGISNIPLPVTLVSFKGSYAGVVTLEWTASDPYQFSHFDIERSTDGIHFESIGKRSIPPSASGDILYSFTDTDADIGANYYRLKMVDLDGKVAYSRLISIHIPVRKNFSVKIDQEKGKLYIYSNQNATIDIYTISGSRLKSFYMQKGSRLESLPLSSGIYVVKRRETGEVVKIGVTQ